MVSKRKSSSLNEGAPPKPKRTRISESAQQSPAVKAPPLSSAEKSRLSTWLDKRELAGPIFDIVVAPHNEDAKKARGGKWHQEEFVIKDRVYLPVVEYSIKQHPKWEALTKFRKCTVGDETFEPGQCIFVNGGEQAEAADGSGIDTLTQWKALLHEIRALDANHVYLRVSWLMRPEDLESGRKSYHGRYELIPSNHMSIVNAMSVNGSVTVTYWDELEDSQIPEDEEYFWRQTNDMVTNTLSKCRIICTCKQAHNPDEMILHCNSCDEWLHVRCVALDAVERATKTDVKQEANGEGHPTMNGTSDSTKAKAKTKCEDAAEEDAQEDALIEADVQIKDATGTASKITITDRRSGTPVVEVSDLLCLHCQKKID